LRALFLAVIAVGVVGADDAVVVNGAAVIDVAAGDGGRGDEHVEAGGCLMTSVLASPAMVGCS
jgi:hypothetical protein